MSAQSAMRLTKKVKKLEKPRPLKPETLQNRHTIVNSRLSSVEDEIALVDDVPMHIMDRKKIEKKTTGPAEDTNKGLDPVLEHALRRACSGPLEQPDKERVGGSRIKLNSSASDSNRLVQGMNRTKLLHSLSTNDDASLGVYKSTVIVGNHSLNITGSNLDLVRAAKLVLDNYLVEDGNQYIGAGNFFTSYEDETAVVDAATPVGYMPSRVGSMDSAATSASDETYKATGISTYENKSEDTIELYPPTVLRQPCFPDASNEYCELKGISAVSTDVIVQYWRALYGIANQQQPNVATLLNFDADISNAEAPRKVQYSREFLLSPTISAFSCETPVDWEQITYECPAISQKATGPFEGAMYFSEVARNTNACSDLRYRNVFY